MKTFFRKIFIENVRAKKSGVKKAKKENIFICEKLSGYGTVNKTYANAVQNKRDKNIFTKDLCIHIY